MSRRALALLLVVSLLFNLAVLVGFMRSRSTMPVIGPPTTSPAEKSLLERVATELRLDQTQTGALQDLRHRQQQQASVFGDSLLVVRQDLQAELRKQQPDLDQVRTLVDQEIDLQRQRRLAEADLYGEFVTLLSPQQRQQLSERVAQPPPSRPQQQQQQRGPASPDIVRRFDRNRNGRLDPDEAKEARVDVQNRRREVSPQQPRPMLWPWFDADDDGELNEAERAEMEAFMREHHAPPRPPKDQQGPPQGGPGGPGGPGGGVGPDGRGPGPDRRGGPEGGDRSRDRGGRPPNGPDGPNGANGPNGPNGPDGRSRPPMPPPGEGDGQPHPPPPKAPPGPDGPGGPGSDDLA